MLIPLSQPSITSLEKRYVNEALADNWISGTGNFVTRFENALAAKVGRKYAIAVSNGTVALEVTLRALGIGVGDEVIVPALTFVAPAAAVVSVGAIPVFVDIDPLSWCLDPHEVSAYLSPKTKAVIAVDLLGHPANFEALRRIVGDIPIIEDAAQAHGAAMGSKLCGSFGLISTFSFHANKAITTGEGGAILTDDEGLAQEIRLLANHGMSADRPYWHEVVGTNARMTNLSAAVGLAQVERWNELIEKRKQITCWYRELLPEYWHREYEDCAIGATWLHTLQGATPEIAHNSIKRLRLMAVDARPIWTALPALPPYQKYIQYFQMHGTTRQLAQTAFWLPTFADMTYEQVRFVADMLKEALNV
jgi:perosamine synthetase